MDPAEATKREQSLVSQFATDGGPHLLTDVFDDILLELDRRFAPFVRKDVYGPMGKGDLPLEEKILLATALVTLVPLRLTVGSAIVILYYLICRLCTAFDWGEERGGGGGYTEWVGWRIALLVDGGRFLARLMLFTLGFIGSMTRICLQHAMRIKSLSRCKPMTKYYSFVHFSSSRKRQQCLIWGINFTNDDLTATECHYLIREEGSGPAKFKCSGWAETVSQDIPGFGRHPKRIQSLTYSCILS